MSDEGLTPAQRASAGRKRGAAANHRKAVERRKAMTKEQREAARYPERYRKFITGEMSVEDLDLEELSRGMLRNLDGTFKGSAPRSLPIKFYKAMAAEYQRRVEQQHRVALNEAYETLRAIAKAPGALPMARVQAANSLLDRLAGPVGQTLEITAEIRAVYEDLLDEAQPVKMDLKQIESTQDAEVVVDFEVDDEED